MTQPRYESPQQPHVCPKCGSTRIADVLYGLPDFSDELQQDLDAGKIVLGGCCVTGDDPVWRCRECGLEIYKKTK
ncbi:hypothetical protein LOC68_25260 [Blastopirellula sp. JC732]|uniref:Uncharacterized protein n=1 Tax=Blastopirellula sediminis TaxID=2894196 RepID=A0A9X1MSG6_9BACT|nr:hypothetical protein [Blastopirellula sediminis]MCC9604981.1 hypothetical protein [Blastopirellula sediminis]MCC9631719.1 hypothetical protein [Blastopirellula sediminis]